MLRKLIRKGSVSVRVVADIFCSDPWVYYAVCAAWEKVQHIHIGYAKAAEINSNIDGSSGILRCGLN